MLVAEIKAMRGPGQSLLFVDWGKRGKVLLTLVTLIIFAVVK